MAIKITRNIASRLTDKYPVSAFWGLADEKVVDISPTALERKGFSKAQALAYTTLVAKTARTATEAKLLFFIYSGDAEKSTDLELITAAFDVLMRLDGFRELEFRCDGSNIEPYHLDNASYEEFSKNSDAKLIAKGELFRRARIFAHNFKWPNDNHKRLWLLHHDDGLTLQEIGENHYTDNQGRVKKVSKCWLSSLFKRYRDKMDVFFVENPHHLIDDSLEYEEGFDDINSLAYMDSN